MPDLKPPEEMPDEILEVVRKSEAAAIESGREFAEAVIDAVPGSPEVARKIVDQAFNITERILATQRDLARKVIETLPTQKEGETAKATSTSK